MVSTTELQKTKGTVSEHLKY